MDYPAGTGGANAGFGVRAAAATMRPGGVVGDRRYRLLAQFGEDQRAGAQFWRARDGQLNRDVALTVLIGDPAESQAAADAGRTLERAMHAATFVHPGVARVLDVLSLGSGVVPSEGILGIVVAEWTHGTDLLDVVSDGPVPATTATRLLEPLASAVESAHHAGLVLGVDHPQRVRVTPDGALRLAFPGPLPMATLRDDVKGLGALLYLLLTGRWALANGPQAVPGAPTGPDGTVVAPNILRPMVPAELSAVAVRSMEDTAVGGIRTSAAILRVLDRVAEAEAATTMLPPVQGTPGGRPPKRDEGVWITKKPVTDRRTKRKLAVFVTLLAVGTIAIVVWLVTSVIGFFSSSDNNSGTPVPGSGTTAHVATTTTAPPATTTAALGAPVKPTTVAEFNVPGHNGDNPGKAMRVIDGDPGTVWKTDKYYQPFPALKPGIGLIATFAQPVKLAEVDIDSPSAGTVVQIRTATSPTADINSMPVIGNATLTNGHTEIKLAAAQPTQYVLVWITTLAGSGADNESSIGEITYVQSK
ncbi:MAG TPA: protein kinase family protein [Pseudonocardiaceae bacterium]|nr:protein kinase family protein [Pseudonocardiaceae bacterium]